MKAALEASKGRCATPELPEADRSYARHRYSSFSTTTMAVIHHPEFYLADGDLVICSSPEDDAYSTVFRVHKAVFAYNSPVFRDMFALPNNPSAQEMFEGVPLVRVIDSEEEFEQLIKALYNPRCVCCSLPGATCTQEHINRLLGFSPFRVDIQICPSGSSKQ